MSIKITAPKSGLTRCWKALQERNKGPWSQDGKGNFIPTPELMRQLSNNLYIWEWSRIIILFSCVFGIQTLIQIIDIFDFYFIPNIWIQLNLGWLPAHKLKKFGVSQNRLWLIFVVHWLAPNLKNGERPCSSKRRTVAPTLEQLENHFSNTTQQPAQQRCYMQSKMMWTHPWPRALPKFLLWAF